LSIKNIIFKYLEGFEFMLFPEIIILLNIFFFTPIDLIILAKGVF
jgi:hypothetical protein